MADTPRLLPAPSVRPARGRAGARPIAIVAAGAARLALGAVAIAAVALSAPSPAAAQAPDYAELAERVATLTRDARYPEALEAAQRFAAVARSSDGEQSPVYASAIAWVGHLYQKSGRLADAEPLLERSLAIFEKVLPPGHPNIATATGNLGFQHQLSGRYEDAERLYKRALEMRETAAQPSPEQIAESLNNLAQIYKRQWRVAEAVPLLRRAVELRERAYGPDARPVAMSLGNLASAMEMQTEIKPAEPLLRRALAIFEKRLAPDHPETAGARNKLAQNLFKQGRYDAAEPLFRAALAAYRKMPDGSNIDIVATLGDLGSNLIEQGRLDEAEPLFTEGLRFTRATLPPAHPSIARMQMGLAELDMRRGDVTAALVAVREASRVRIARSTTDELSRLTFQKHVRIAWMAAAAGGEETSRKLLDEALTMAQRATLTQTASAVQAMAARFAAKDAGLQALVRQREDLDTDTTLLEQQLSAVLALPRDKRAAADEDLRQRIAAAGERIAAIDAELKRRFPEYFNLVRPEPLDRAKVQGLLTPDEAMVVMTTGYDGTYVWAISRDAAAWHKSDLTVDQLNDAVLALRDSLDVETLKDSLRSTPKLFDLSLAAYLYDKLLKPVESVIRDRKHLVTVPYGPLSSLPLQVLVTGGPILARPKLEHLPMYQEAHWLVRRHAVSVLPSVGALEGLRVLARSPGREQRPMIGFGDPVFTAAAAAETRSRGRQRPPKAAARSAPRGKAVASRTRSFTAYWRGSEVNLEALRDLPALPETADELRTVARHLNASEHDLRLGTAATETEVKQMDLSRYRIIYFATHGLVAGEVKGLAEPALALSPPARISPLDDGLLTASEVAHLRLDADWVVLAACNTAAGEAPGAEALSGLARAFFYAGARALLVSHWRVGSEAAAKLTTSTFEAQQANPGSGRAEALQRAMLGYIGDRKDPWAAYPGFWAPFSVVGEGGRRMPDR